MRSSMALIASSAFVLASCSTPEPQSHKVNYGIRLPDGELGLEPLPPDAPIPDYSIAWQERHLMMDSIRNSLTYLAAPSSHNYFPYGPISHTHMVDSLERFYELLETSTSADQFRSQVADEFEVWVARGRKNSGDVLFTGYCRPLFRGSLHQEGPYQHPLYKLPPDLVKGDGGSILGRRTEGGAVVPYYSAAELQKNGHLDGLELVWLEDPFNAYIAQVQGSAIIELPDGQRMEIGYAGKNGHEYVSIGLKLIEEGKIHRDRLSLDSLQKYFRDHPAEVDRVLPMNPSFVFFQPSEGGPFGSLGQQVLPRRSVATDKTVFPRAGLIYCEVRLPEYDSNGRLLQRPMRFFTCDQDTGGAIRSAGRCDVFLGTGDEAMARAGQVFSVGRLFYLFLKRGSYS